MSKYDISNSRVTHTGTVCKALLHFRLAMMDMNAGHDIDGHKNAKVENARRVFEEMLCLDPDD
jgi:hypothetical protein